jgi:hypothetical protein
VGGWCCCYNDAPLLLPQSQQNKLSIKIKKGERINPPKRKLREKIKDYIPNE